MTRLRPIALALITAGIGISLALTGCSPQATSPSEVDTPVAEDAPAEQAEEAPASPPCELADISSVVTPAFATFADTSLYGQVNGNTSIADTRCQIPGDAEILGWLGGQGFQIDGIANISDNTTFYLATNGTCLLEVAYFRDEGNYSPFKLDTPEKLRFATPSEALDAGYAQRCA